MAHDASRAHTVRLGLAKTEAGMRKLPLWMMVALLPTILAGAALSGAGEVGVVSSAPPTSAAGTTSTTAASDPAASGAPGPSGFACGERDQTVSATFTPGPKSPIHATPDAAASAVVAELRAEPGADIEPEPQTRTYRDETGRATASAAGAQYWTATYGTARRAGIVLEVAVERLEAGWVAMGVRGCMDTLGGEFVPTVDP